MKKIKAFLKKALMIMALVVLSTSCFAQAQEIEQLLLDVEKLSQFKQILSDLKKGYDILNGGYNAIKDISQGNFNLHQTFLDALMQVSPVVKNYVRVADIISLQSRIVREYKTAYNQFKADGHFTTSEIDYLGKVYSNLFNKSMQSLDDLITVVTAGKLRMNDEERLKAIDHVWNEVQEQYGFLRGFNGSTQTLSLARQREQQEVDVMKALNGIK